MAATTDERVLRARDTIQLYESDTARGNLGYEGERLFDVLADLLAYVVEGIEQA